MTTQIPNHTLRKGEPSLKELNTSKTIVIGVGNSSRGDDGLGWEFLKELESGEDFQGIIEYRYLLLVEDASLISNYANVIFIDASKEKLEEGFAFRPVIPGSEFKFSTHIIPPESILYLSEELYESKPNTFTLAIEGVQWKLGEGLSGPARQNLKRAIEFFKEEIMDEA